MTLNEFYILQTKYSNNKLELINILNEIDETDFFEFIAEILETSYGLAFNTIYNINDFEWADISYELTNAFCHIFSYTNNGFYCTFLLGVNCIDPYEIIFTGNLELKLEFTLKNDWLIYNNILILNDSFSAESEDLTIYNKITNEIDTVWLFDEEVKNHLHLILDRVVHNIQSALNAVDENAPENYVIKSKF